jgi:hypothetical protein
VETKILSDLFDQTEFKTFVLKRAKDSDFVGSLLDDLIEPPPPGTGEAIPFLGEIKTYEFILGVAARGDIFLNVGGSWIGRRAEDATDEDALRYIRSRAFRTGQEMRQIQLGLPGTVGGGTVTVPPKPVEPPSPGGQPGTPPAPPYPPIGNGIGGGVTSGEGENPPDAPPPPVASINKRADEPVTGINLSGCFEKWGISSTQTIDSARIEFSGLTAQQIKQILQRIPSTFKATMEISYKEGDGQ